MSELDIVYELSVTTASHDEIKMLFFFLFFFIYNGGAFRNTIGCQLSDGGSGDFKRDLRSRNRIYWARLRGGVLQYRLLVL